jgi:long-chain acyl-CoA synthetase
VFSDTNKESITYGVLIKQVKQLQSWLVVNEIKSVALMCDNSPQWIIIDLACQSANIILTPIPAFFSAKQIHHLLSSVKATLLFSENDVSLPLDCEFSTIDSPLPRLNAIKFNDNCVANVPNNTSKITFTSGSTGEPKGVCLSTENQLNVALALVDKIAVTTPRHLSLLSFSTLLENVAGLYAPLLAGGTLCIATDKNRGFNGAQLTDLKSLLSFVSASKPQTMILVPELLQVLLLAISQGWRPPTELEFIAVGGSRVSTKLWYKAKALGLPVYQGYGLSECSSVVSINSKSNSSSLKPTNIGAGEILPHLVAEVINGELVLRGNAFLGYLNRPESWYPTQIFTGDLVSLEDNNLVISGRKKNILINSYGRNISPEWPEAELMASGIFQQVVVLGDSKPFCIALLVPFSIETAASTPAATIQAVLDQVNTGLPEYAQIKDFIQLNKMMSFADGLTTSNGRPKRDVITQYYHQEIKHVYASHIQEDHLAVTVYKT